MTDIDYSVSKLLDLEIMNKDKKIEFSEEAKELIHCIAVQCMTIPIVKDTQKQAEKYAEKLSAEEIYLDMLNKILNAPTWIHMRMVARMLIPIIDQKLQEA